MLKKIILISILISNSILNGTIKICLIGGPGSGKTTILNRLKNTYETIEEAASFLIRKALTEKKPHPLINNPEQFQKDIVKTQIEFEENTENKNESIVIIDGGIPNNYVFCEFLNITLPSELQEKVDKHKKYDYVFFLEFPKNYKNDPINSFTHEESLKIHQITKDVYEKIGYKLINIPFFEKISDRVKFVEDKIKELIKQK